MSDKTIRYIAWGVGSLIVLAILFINDGSFSRYGLFASSINKTMVYDLFKDVVREFGVYSSTARSWAYFLWFACFGFGVFLSWKYRFKTSRILSHIFKSIHDKA